MVVASVWICFRTEAGCDEVAEHRRGQAPPCTILNSGAGSDPTALRGLLIQGGARRWTSGLRRLCSKRRTLTRALA